MVGSHSLRLKFSLLLLLHHHFVVQIPQITKTYRFFVPLSSCEIYSAVYIFQVSRHNSLGICRSCSLPLEIRAFFGPPHIFTLEISLGNCNEPWHLGYEISNGFGGQFGDIVAATLPKINIEPKKEVLEDDLSFQLGRFHVNYSRVHIQCADSIWWFLHVWFNIVFWSSLGWRTSDTWDFHIVSLRDLLVDHQTSKSHTRNMT